MYLPAEFDPAEAPMYLVVRNVRTTGARVILNIVGDLTRAEELARNARGYVLEIDRVADFR